MDTLELTREATAARQKIDEGRQQLVRAVRQASREGLSQRAIAQATGTSQPEISRLLRFRGTSSHSRLLRKHRAEVLAYLKSRGLENVRVFGSVATGNDTEESDIDLLVTASQPLGLLVQAEIASELEKMLGIPVDLVFDHAIRPDLEDRILGEAITL